MTEKIRFGVIGGSGVYQMEALRTCAKSHWIRRLGLPPTVT